MKRFLVSLSLGVLVLLSMGAGAPAKPKLKVAPDGYPSGHDTPEGAACDLARAFIRRDVALFTNTCLRPYGAGSVRTNYAAFLNTTVAAMRAESAKKNPSPNGPKAIGKVFAARHLSKKGPVTYGAVTFKFQDVMFVDVGAFFHDGGRGLNRNLVIKDSTGKWYVHPIPQISPLLCAGLNEEPKSREDFSEAYDLRK